MIREAEQGEAEALLSDPRIRPWVTYEGFDGPFSEHHLTLIEPERAVWLFDPFMVPDVMVCHVASKPGYDIRSASLDVIDFLAENGVFKLLAFVPSDNTRARYFAAGLGFEREGEITGLWPRNGRRHNVVIYGLKICQQQPHSYLS